MKFLKYILLLVLAIFVIDVPAKQLPKSKRKKRKKKATEEVSIKVKKVLTQDDEDAFIYNFSEGLKRKSLGQINKASVHFIKCLKIDSTSSACYYELANFASTEGDINNALVLSKKAVHFNPNNKWYLMQLAKLYQNKRMISHADKVYEKLIELEPDNLKYYITKAGLLISAKEWDKALKNYDIIESQFGIIPYVSLQKQNIFIRLNQKDLAYKEIFKLIEKFPTNVDYIGLLADMYNEDKQPEKAFEQYQKILEKDPNNGLVRFFLSDYYLRKKDFENALSEFELGFINKDVDPYFKMQRLAVLSQDSIEQKDILKFCQKFVDQNPEIIEGHLFYAQYLRLDEKDEKAKEEIFVVLEKDSVNYNALQQLASIYSNQQNYDSLRIITRKGIKNYPSDPWFHLFNGWALMNLEKYNSAEKILIKGKRFVANDEELLLQFKSFMADNYYKMGKKNKAFSLYEEILLLDPDNILILNNYSYYLSLEKEKLYTAERMSKKCIEKEPNNSTYLDTYAWVLYASGKYSEAKEYIEKAVDEMDEDNQSGVILEHYGDILFKLGEIEKAIEYWEKGYQIGSDDNSLLQRKINSRELIEKD